MPKKYRLTGEEMKNLFRLNGGRVGKRVHGRFFSLLVSQLPSGGAKCAVVVSKKVSAKAVDRNKIQRRMRNLLAKRVATLQKPVALVFHAKREAKDAAFADLSADIDSLFSKL